jgi:hypothetical protein
MDAWAVHCCPLIGGNTVSIGRRATRSK